MAVAVFVVLFAGLVVWTTVAMPGPIPDINVEVWVPAFAASPPGNSQPVNREEAP